MSKFKAAPTRAPRVSPQDARRAALAGERASLQRQFDAGQMGREVLRHLTLLTDRHLRLAWKSHQMPDEIALIAVGGYGRGQLFPHSDVDILILLPTSPSAVLREKLEALVGTFWDIGLDVGHSVRTLDECFEIASGDVTVQTTLLESRLITGNRELYRRFTRKVQQTIDPAAFLSAKRIEQQERHSRHQETNLEPNLKESAGGLRDLNTILWISRAAGLGRTWLELARRGFITRDEAGAISRHEPAVRSPDHARQTARFRQPRQPARQRTTDAALLPDRKIGIPAQHHSAAESGAAYRPASQSLGDHTTQSAVRDPR